MTGSTTIHTGGGAFELCTILLLVFKSYCRALNHKQSLIQVPGYDNALPLLATKLSPT